MRQFEWDKSMEDLCSSPEEVQELKKVASLLWDMPETQSSSSFQAELKAQLMEKALSGEKFASKENKVLYLINKGYKYGTKILQSRPLLTAAAAVLVIISLTVLYNRGQVEPFSPEITSTEKPPGIAVTQNHKPDDMETEQQTPTVEQEPEVKPPDESNDTPRTGETVPEKTTTPVDNPSVVEGSDEPEVSAEQPAREDPEFEAWKNRQSFRLAGVINLPSVYYKVEQDATVPAENVRYSWKPRKTVFSADPGEARIFGTEAWVAEDLSNNGFIVREGDYLETNLHETQKGLFAEVFYRPHKSADNALTLVLHYQDGTGILSYYYKEEGEVGQPGFYPLLSPAEAFKQADGLKWYAPSQRLDFSFQEVALTYHDFLLEESGRQKSVKLPAYRFLGRETLNNGGELVLYLPAVK